MKGLSGKNVLVTGASSGIGRAIAVRLAAEGANVAINYHKDEEGARKTADMAAKAGPAGVRTFVIQANVADEDDAEQMVRKTIEELGSLDVLVNNAGVQLSAPSDEMPAKDFDLQIAIDLRGAFICAREAIKHFLSRSFAGVIVNISSVHQIIPKPNYVAYSAAKGAIGNLTRTLALEYCGKGIRVNAIAPGAILTPMNKDWADDPKARAEVESHIPMGRAGTGEEVAAAVAFIAGDEAAYVTGQTLYVDGGLTLYPDFRTDWSSKG